jgi:hypothetical protein
MALSPAFQASLNVFLNISHNELGHGEAAVQQDDIMISHHAK